MQEALPKGDINATTAKTQGNVYKALHTAMKRYGKYKPEKERDDWLFLAILYSFNNSIFDFGIGGVLAGTIPVIIPNKRGSLDYTDIRAKVWIHLGTHHSTDEVTLQ